MRYGQPRKYRNQPVMLDGIRFDSQREARRYLELRLMEKAGVISELVADKKALRYTILINGVKVCTYTPDFQFREHGRMVTEDTKGVKTQVYQLKKRLMKAVFGIEIREI